MRWNLTFEFLAIVFTFLSGILMVPVYLGHIPAQVYGYWLASGNVIGWLASVDPGFSSVVQQRVAVSFGAGQRDKVAAYASMAVVMGAAFGLLVCLAGWGMLHLLPAILDTPPNYAEWDSLVSAFHWSLLGAALSLASYSLTAVAVGMQGALGPGVLYTLTQVLGLALSFHLLLTGWGVRALGIANFARGAGLFITALGYLMWRLRREQIPLKIQRSVFVEVSHLSFYTFLSKAAASFAGQMDALVATRFLGPESAVVFSLTRKGYDVGRMVAERPAIALKPAVSHLHGEGDRPRVKAVVLRMLRFVTWTIGGLVCGFVATNDDFLRQWVGAQFYAGTLVNVLIAGGVAGSIFMSTCGHLAFAIGDVQRSSAANLAISLATGIGLWVGGATLGMSGMAAAALIATALVGSWYFPAALFNQLQLDKDERSSLRREAGSTALVAAVTATLFSFPSAHSWPAFLGLASGSALVYALGVAMVSHQARVELKAAFAFLLRRRIVAP